MQIIFSPQNGALLPSLDELIVQGDTIAINGIDHDLTSISFEGDSGLVADAGYIQSAIHDGDDWTVTLLLPIGDSASEAQRFPVPVTVDSGPVPLPEPPEAPPEDPAPEDTL
ncbi:hypothetical protein RPE78_09665 [Thioclava litoralis]|uniref:IPT/TIG domain-containing protein n=1 Tax=Thioclava litoralis TaxID=3076557 RepID=A0ABZ1DYL9_9RHOB|nr:hypothetical protein RPE78_09665 [Thioclava sp. FTW29]